ncbi:MAG: hypothetical protein KAR40_08000 [Candidatus Sabulitectum sp.]|nr:hypothetical protein [Candidatus Sabulitectum sp.]
MRQTTINIMQFEELSDRAKEVARQWWRSCAYGDEWWENIYSDAETIGLKITGFDTSRSEEITGEFIDNPEDTAKQILLNHGEECETVTTAQAFLDGGSVDEDIEEWVFDDQNEEEFLSSLLNGYLVMLREEELDYFSDEAVDESITINEYEFTEDGSIF